MRTAFLLYRNIDGYARPFAIDFDSDYSNQMALFKDVDYIQLPYNEACFLYDNKLDVLQYAKEKRNDIS
jgi:hypothetical protein